MISSNTKQGKRNRKVHQLDKNYNTHVSKNASFMMSPNGCISGVNEQLGIVTSTPGTKANESYALIVLNGNDLTSYDPGLGKYIARDSIPFAVIEHIDDMCNHLKKFNGAFVLFGGHGEKWELGAMFDVNCKLIRQRIAKKGISVGDGTLLWKRYDLADQYHIKHSSSTVHLSLIHI